MRSLHATVMRRLVPGDTDGAVADRCGARCLSAAGGPRQRLSRRCPSHSASAASWLARCRSRAAAKHLGTRDIDGVVLGEGFSLRVIDAFLAGAVGGFAVSQSSRRGRSRRPRSRLRSGEISRSSAGDAARVASIALPLVRRHAFEAQLSRTLKAIDADGLIDARAGFTHGRGRVRTRLRRRGLSDAAARRRIGRWRGLRSDPSRASARSSAAPASSAA